MDGVSLVFAHPDDETFATGGTVAKLAQSGVHVSLYCATDGDAGRSSGIAVSSRAELASLRRNELHVAARRLGIRAVACGGHADGALAATEWDVLTGEIVRFLRAQAPHTVITFGPEGAPTGHRDHKHISAAATAAWFLAANPSAFPDAGPAHAVAGLYYVTWPAPAPDAELQLRGVAATVKVDVRAQLAAKEEAFHAHATQRQHEARFRELGLTDEEWFGLAAGTESLAGRV
jgi:N-acetylglucosamine malate deacetylase 2